MTSSTLSNPIEDKLYAATRVPQPRPEFLAELRARLAGEAIHPVEPPRRVPLGERIRMAFRRPAWVMAIIVLFLLAGILGVIGPQRVLAAFRQILGYIPGVGLVNQTAPIRVLAEPVRLTRDGITVSVNRATLAADRTQIDYGVSGVPLSAYPPGEAVSGCIEREYLRLPNGTKIEVEAPIPAGVDEATFVLPCIFNTLPGAVPTDWELALRFIPAPPDLTVMPVIEVTSTAQEIPTESLPLPGEGETVTPTAAQAAIVVVEKVIETGDGYILLGAIRLHLGEDQSIAVTGAAIIHDANGSKVAYTFPQDINEYQILDLDKGDQPFSIQIKATGVAFPLTIEVPGKIITPADPDATAELTFDAGPNPQPGQEWTLNQQIELAGRTLTLVSITADSRNGYSFRFETSGDIASLSVQIDGYTPLGGGGGGDYQGMINQSLAFAELPTGNLKIVFSRLMLASETQFWQGQWSPESVRSDWPTATPAAFPVCLNAEAFSQVQPLPAGLDGRALLTEMNPELNLVVASLDGSQRQVLAAGSSRGAFSPDGQKVAYPGNNGIVILDLSTNTTTELGGPAGYDLSWSPDGAQIAYVTAGDAYGVFIAPVADGSTPKQISNLGYETLAGWSPDGSRLYYAIPGATGDGFLLRSVEVQTGATLDLFVLEDSSRKAPMPAVSPDGAWIAYRASDNSSLYLKAMNGSPARLLLDNPASAINGPAWDKGSHLLGVSLITPEAQDGVVILLQPDNCEVYRLPGLHGELDGITIP